MWHISPPTRIVLTFATGETVCWGILFYSFAVFQLPMGEEFGWSSAALTGGFSLALLISGIAAPFVGHWIDVRGPRLIMAAGAALGTCSVAAWANVESLPAFYAVMAVMGLAVSATLYDPAFAAITHWFDGQSRRRALLWVTIAAGFASSIFLPLTQVLIERYDWRDALLIYSLLIALLVMAPYALFLRAPVEQSTNEGTTAVRFNNLLPNKTLLSDRSILTLAVAFSAETFAMIAAFFHLVPYLAERGSSVKFAATAAGLVGAAQVAARLTISLGEHWFSLVRLAVALLIVESLALMILLISDGSAAIVASVLLLGAGRGGMTLLRPGLVADGFPVAQFGAVNGVLSSFTALARAAAPVLTGIAISVIGDFDPVYVALAMLPIIAASLLVFFQRRHLPAHRRQIEE